MSPTRILGIGAHPDDVEIYMFGTLAAARARGDEVAIAIATDGSRGGTAEPAQLRLTRQAEARAAAALVGAEPVFLDFPDGTLVPDATTIGAIKALIAEVGPHLVITHAANDYHGDHRALSEAVRLAASFSTPVLYADTLGGVGFAPTHYVDIGAHAALKAEAIRCHGSQDPERLVSLAETLGRFRSAQANLPDGHAEAFRFDPIFPFVDIRDLLPPAPPVHRVRDRSRPA